jgi:hypothetical protein
MRKVPSQRYFYKCQNNVLSVGAPAGSDGLRKFCRTKAAADAAKATDPLN